MRSPATLIAVLFGLGALSGLPCYAQNKTACALLSQADAESVLGVTLQPPKPTAPFRSLLDADFTSGTPDQGCHFANFAPNQPTPAKVVNVSLEVRYSTTPDPHAVDEARQQVDTRTYDHPTDLAGLGDAAFWIGAPNNVTLFVFLGGTTRLMIGPSDIGLEQEKALAAKALAALRKAGFSYGTPSTGLTKPVLGKPGPNPSGIDLLKRALTAKADAGDPKSQLALGGLYKSGTLASDGSAQHDDAGAAYWYRQASDHGVAQARYELAIAYRDGLGVPADASQSFQLLQKAAEAGYVPAMSLLSDTYAEQKTPVSGERATYWAMKAADAGTIVAVQTDVTASIWIAPSDHADDIKQVTQGRNDGLHGLDFASPQKIIFSSNDSGNWDLSAVNLATGATQIISGAPQYHSSPVVCDSGRTVVFVSNAGGGNHLWKTEADGTNRVQLTHGAGEVYPQCPREGRWVAFIKEDETTPGGNLRKLSLDGGADRAVIPNIVVGVNLAPDGKHILFAAVPDEEDNKVRVGRATLDDTAPIAYYDPPPKTTVLREGRWIPGQQALAYVDTRSGSPNIWTYSLAGHPSQQLTHFLSGRIFGIAFSPDGTKIAMSRGSINSDVVLFSRNR